MGWLPNQAEDLGVGLRPTQYAWTDHFLSWVSGSVEPGNWACVIQEDGCGDDDREEHQEQGHVGLGGPAHE